MGYVACLICVLFIINAHQVSFEHGVAGKVWMNSLATTVGGMMVYHLTQAILCIRRHDQAGHVWHIVGVLGWIAQPGLGRVVGSLVQIYVTGDDCDFLYTNGWMIPIIIGMVTMMHTLRWSIMGTKFRFGDYTFLWIMMAADVLMAVPDDSFLQCPKEPMMAQVLGQAWVLEPSAKSLWNGSLW